MEEGGKGNMDDLLERIRMGEDSRLEFKLAVVKGGKVISPDSRSLADEFSAMANSVSGTLLIGVDDKTRTAKPMEVSELDVLETWVRNICNDIIDPPLPCVISKVPVGNGKGILRVDVAQSVFVHKGGHGYFTRIGSSKRELSPDMLSRLFQQKSQTRIVCFDEQKVAQAAVIDLDSDLYRRFRTPLSDQDDAAFLRKLHFVADDENGVARPTVSGILMACRTPEAFLPSAYIQAVAYRGKERTAAEQLDARDITGPLDVQISEAVRFVKRNMRIYAIKTPGRLDIPQFSLASVFEAVVNAVVHRDYSIRGAKIRLHMFSDRLEIFSPGGLPNSMQIDELSERQFARNELLCSVLSRCKLTEVIQNVNRQTIMDRRGEGVPIIYSEGMKTALKRPEYRLVGESELLLTLYSAPGDSVSDLLKVARNYTEDSTDLKTRILLKMRDTPHSTQEQLARECQVSRSTIANAIRMLKESGAIRRIGSDRNGSWVVQ